MTGLGTDYRPFPRRQERDAWNALPERKRAQLLSWADESGQGYPMVTATQFLAFCRTGDRMAYEKPYFARRNRLMGAGAGRMSAGRRNVSGRGDRRAVVHLRGDDMGAQRAQRQ